MLKKLNIPVACALSIGCLVLTWDADANQGSNIRPVSDGRPNQQKETSNWNYVLGMGGGYAQAYEGSDKYKGIPVPVINIDYKGGLFFLNVRDGIGSYPLRGERYKVGVSVAYAPDRRESDDRKNLQGMGKLKASATANLLAEYDFGIVKLAGRVTTAVSGDYGTTALLSLSSNYPLTRKIILTGSVSAMWGDEEHMNNRFGVTGAQSAASGYSPYVMEAGLKSVVSSIGISYLITDKWTASLTVGAGKLLGDVADSPVVKEDVVPAGFLTISYRF